jgi:streptogramin lyase
MAVTSFTVSPTSGFVYGTEFLTTNTSPNKNILRFVWDFGDGSNLYYTQQPTHIYQLPGSYTISLSSIDPNGVLETFNTNIFVEYLYRDYITFTNIPENYSNPGKKQISTFKFNVVSSQITPILKVNLFVANSKSIPYEQVKDYKWNFLIPTWKFLDSNDNFITSLNLPITPLYYNNNVVGVSSTGEFFYVDSTSTGDPTKNCPLLITATLETSGTIYKRDSNINNYSSYANNKSVTTGVVWFVNDLTPDLLKITGNYIDNIHPQKWVGVKIPTMITCHSSLANKLPGGDPTVSEILFNYPQNNNLGNSALVNVTLQDTNNTPFELKYQNVENAPLFFQQKDSNNNDVGGFIFTSISSRLSGLNTTIAGYTTAYNDFSNYTVQDFPYPGPLAPQPSVWVSNPSRNTLNKITLLPYSETCNSISYYKTNKLLVDGYIRQIDVPFSKSDSTFNYNTSGSSGIYGLAIDPRDYSVYAADGDTDCLYKFNTTGALISTLSLSSTLSVTIATSSVTANSTTSAAVIAAIQAIDPTPETYEIEFTGPDSAIFTFQVSVTSGIIYNPEEERLTPASISLDQDYNLWVSLFNSVSVLKFDDKFNFLFSAVPNNSSNLSNVYDYISDGDFVNKPPVVQTDRNNNCWTAYSHPLCSFLVQYETNGSLIADIILPNNSVPVDLAINSENNLWVANSYNTTPFFGSIELYDTQTTNLLSSFTGFSRPSYLALDRNNNLWFTHNINDIGFINSRTGELKLWQTNTNNSTVTFIEQNTPYYLQPENEQYDETVGGFAIDVYNRIWFIDSYNNYAWTIPVSTNLTELTARTFKIRPDSVLGYYTDPINFSTIIDENPNYKSAQAFGDWTGNQWYQKYTNILTLSALPISGISTPFSIFPLTNNYEIRKVNDSFDTGDYFYSLALPEILKTNNNLFKKLLPGVVGDGKETFYQDPGQEIYEKIANFTINNSDVDTCNIQQLLSLADQTATSHSNYDLDLPVNIKKIINLASIPHTKLWGTKDMNIILNESLGNELNTFTDYITADTFIILRNKFDTSLHLVKVPPISSTIPGDITPVVQTVTLSGDNDSVIYSTSISRPTVVYPLSVYEGHGFIQPVFSNYIFYNVNAQYLNTYIENIIDWDSEFTTLTPQQSTYEEWFGDNGIIEKNFNYYLTKNLVVE